MAHLTMDLGTEELLNKVNNVCTDEQPGRFPYKLIELLKEEYQLKDWVKMVEMKQKLSAIKMTKYDEP